MKDGTPSSSSRMCCQSLSEGPAFPARSAQPRWFSQDWVHPRKLPDPIAPPPRLLLAAGYEEAHAGRGRYLFN